MEKNLYFRSVLLRKNYIKEAIFDFFLGIASFPRLVIEVFIRKNMGRRYFKRSAATLVAFFMLLLPFFVQLISISFSRYGYGRPDGIWDTIKSNWLWYLFVVAFCVFSYLRYKDIKRIKDRFDMKHFSLSSGDILPFFLSLKYKGKQFSFRQIEIYIEPLAAFLIGLLCIIIGQNLLGWFLIVCSISYSIGYAASYAKGDDFILDKIDEIICNEQLSDAFVSDELTIDGFRFYGDKPKSKEWRQKVYEKFYEDDDNISDAE